MLDDKQSRQAGDLWTSRKPGLGVKYLEEEQIPNSTDNTGKIIPFPFVKTISARGYHPPGVKKKISIF